MAPAGNPITPTKAILGKILFWEEQLSSDNSVACATCHRPESGGGDPRLAQEPGADGLLGTADDRRGSPGVVRSDLLGQFSPDPLFGLNRQVTPRASPSHIMAAYFPNLFWDGRATGTFVNPQTGAVSLPAGAALESQSVGPPLSDLEMAHEQRDWNSIATKLVSAHPLGLASNLPPDVVAALAVSPDYPSLFQQAFGTPAVTAERIAFALATYQRTLRSDQAPIDAFRAGNPAALTPQQAQGQAVFTGPGRCVLCHGGQTFSNNQFVNIGLRPFAEDLGRFAVTGQLADRGRFKVPSLRNVALRSQFMHTGQFTSLAEVVDFYNRGGDFPQNQDPRIIPLGLNAGQRANLVAFLGALTDPRVAAATGVFSRPTLWSETHPMGAPSVGFNAAGTGGVTPRFLAWSPPGINTPDFRIGVANGLGGAIGILGVGQQLAPLGSSLNGTPLILNLADPALFVGTYTLSGSGTGEGFTTVPFPIPDAPSLIGQNFFAQWWVQDAGAAGGFSATTGAVFVVF